MSCILIRFPGTLDDKQACSVTGYHPYSTVSERNFSTNSSCVHDKLFATKKLDLLVLNSLDVTSYLSLRETKGHRLLLSSSYTLWLRAIVWGTKVIPSKGLIFLKLFDSLWNDAAAIKDTVIQRPLPHFYHEMPINVPGTIRVCLWDRGLSVCVNRPTAAACWQWGPLAPTCPLFSTSEGAEPWHKMNRSCTGTEQKGSGSGHTQYNTLAALYADL